MVWCGLDLPRAEAVAFLNGRAIATGSADEITDRTGAETHIVNLGRGFAIPAYHVCALGDCVEQFMYWLQSGL